MKKILLASIMLSLMLSITPALALETGLDYGTFTGLGTRDIREGTMSIVNVLFGFLGIVAIIGIVMGGLIYMTSGGNEDKTAVGKNVIVASIIGLIIVFTAYAISIFVITQLISATGAS